MRGSETSRELPFCWRKSSTILTSSTDSVPHSQLLSPMSRRPRDFFSDSVVPLEVDDPEAF